MYSEILSPLWDIYINGAKILEQKKFIKKILLEESVDGSDTCTIDIIDEDNFFVGDSVFVEDATVKVVIDWMAGKREEFNGFISAFDINFSSEGLTTMSLFCLDNTHRMNRRKRSRTFENMNKESILRLIAQEYGFGCKVSSGYDTSTTSFSQSVQTDIEFCESLAGDESFGSYWRVKLIGNVINYTQYGALSSPVVSLDYKSGKNTIIQFSPKLTSEAEEPENLENDLAGQPSGGIGGGGKTTGGTGKTKIKDWKVTMPDGTVAYANTYKKAEAMLAKARKAAGSVMGLETLKPWIKDYVDNLGEIEYAGKVSSWETRTLPKATTPEKASLLPASKKSYVLTKSGSWQAADEKANPITQNIKRANAKVRGYTE